MPTAFSLVYAPIEPLAAVPFAAADDDDPLVDGAGLVAAEPGRDGFGDAALFGAAVAALLGLVPAAGGMLRARTPTKIDERDFKFARRFGHL